MHDKSSRDDNQVVGMFYFTEMHDKSSRDDNQVVGMFCFQYQHSTGCIFFVSELLATPKSLSIVIAHAA